MERIRRLSGEVLGEIKGQLRVARRLPATAELVGLIFSENNDAVDDVKQEVCETEVEFVEAYTAVALSEVRFTSENRHTRFEDGSTLEEISDVFEECMRQPPPQNNVDAEFEPGLPQWSKMDVVRFDDKLFSLNNTILSCLKAAEERIPSKRKILVKVDLVLNLQKFTLEKIAKFFHAYTTKNQGGDPRIRKAWMLSNRALKLLGEEHVAKR